MRTISPRVLDSATTLATLLGIILAIDAIAQAVRDEVPVAWGVFGVIVAAISAISLLDRLLNFFGDPDNPAGRRSRLIGGGMSWLLFLIFAGTLGFFRFAS